MKGINALYSAMGWRKKLVDESNGRYGIASFIGTIMPNVISDIFRVFSPVNPDKNRKLNAQFGHKLNIFVDSLFDYPTIIQSRLETYGRWEHYNRFISIQLGGCNFRCWYCYCDDDLLMGRKLVYLTPDELIGRFIEQRRKDITLGIESNVLRISGGEPFLAPDLILSCLEKIKELKLENRVFIWSETNLSPFLKEPDSQKSLAEKWGDLDKISRFKNFAVHPCLHGITPENLYENSNIDGDWFDDLVNGLKVLTRHKIDVYPTFSSNTCPPNHVEELFERLLSINKRLPLRFALIDYHLDYPPILKRPSAQTHETVYNKYMVIYKWNELLQNEYGLSYAEVPRHEIPLW